MSKSLMDCINKLEDMEDTVGKLDWMIDLLSDANSHAKDTESGEAICYYQELKGEIMKIEGVMIDYIEKLKAELAEAHSMLKEIQG